MTQAAATAHPERAAGRSRHSLLPSSIRHWAMAAFVMLAMPSAAACPAFVMGEALAPLPAATRQSLRLFILPAQRSAPSHQDAPAPWQPLPLQIDPLDASGILLVPKRGQNLAQEALTELDRIAIDTRNFGGRLAGGEGAPCQTQHLYELVDAQGRYAYLAACKDPAPPQLNAERAVRHDLDKMTISSPLYHYGYQPNNQLVFKSLRAFDSVQKRMLEAGGNADILLHLDVKNFFTLDMTNDNVESYVEASQSGDLGVVGRIQFYLRLLFLKIDLHMATMASFFVDSANIPMVMDVPAHSPSMLHSGSGMLFNWQPKQAVFAPPGQGSTVPRADPKLILSGYERLAAQGAANCKGELCTYKLAGKVEKTPFAIDMQVPRFLVSKGFFPTWVEDMADFTQKMGWTDEAEPKPKGRVGVFFNVSGLPKGQYKMDYWIRLGEGAKGTDFCPARVRMARIVDEAAWRTPAAPAP